MKTLKYTVIRNKEQYHNYCSRLEELISQEGDPDETDLLSVLIEKWDREQNSFKDGDPVEIIKALMFENNLKAIDLTKILGLSKGTVSKILNYHKGISKESIRRLSEYFRISQEALNRPYELKLH